MSYQLSVGGLLLVLPSISFFNETRSLDVLAHHGVAQKWYVFWSVGVRLGLAGLKQITKPSFTAKDILGLKHDESFIVVRELGFANLAMGLSGLVSLTRPEFRGAAVLSGGVFYTLAGINHFLHENKNEKQKFAMYTDFFAGFLLLGSLGLSMSAS